MTMIWVGGRGRFHVMLKTREVAIEMSSIEERSDLAEGSCSHHADGSALLPGQRSAWGGRSTKADLWIDH
jgi:hypothetical protein